MPNVCHSLSASSSFLGWPCAPLEPEMQQTMSLDAEGVTVSCGIFQAITIWCAIQLFIFSFSERIITMTLMPFNNVLYLYGQFPSHMLVPLNKLCKGTLENH